MPKEYITEIDEIKGVDNVSYPQLFGNKSKISYSIGMNTITNSSKIINKS